MPTKEKNIQINWRKVFPKSLRLMKIRLNVCIDCFKNMEDGPMY